MINTYSKFYYGIEITNETKWFDFNEGAGELNLELSVGSHTLESLADELQTGLTNLGALTYTVTVNRSNRTLTIAASGNFSVLIATGTNTAEGCYDVLGISTNSDISTVTSVTSDVGMGSVYSPQYKLQDYVDEQDMRKLRSATKNKATSGVTQVQSFGVDKMFQFSIKFATDIPQPSGGPIINNSSGVAALRSFMQWAITQKKIQFMKDSSNSSSYYDVILESTEYDSSGIGYKLNEQYGRGLVGYFESGALTFRVLED